MILVLGLGSNLGDRNVHLMNAVQLIRKELMPVSAVSSIYESQAMIPKEAPDSWRLPYLNMAVAGESTRKPQEILNIAKQIERRTGREESYPRWSPRVIDIDILAYGDISINTATLTIPHASLLERPFALWPLADVAPGWQHPSLTETAHELAQRFGIRYPEDVTQPNATSVIKL